MKRTRPIGLGLTILGTIAVLGGLSVARGGLYADRYEGDMMHLVEMVLRMAAGKWPHLDFMTPIGVLGTWPIAVFVKAGHGFGMAVHFAQVSVALVLAPWVFWAAFSRFRGYSAHAFAVVVMVLTLALVHGEADPTISLSMHYNRWAWAFSFVALTLAFLPALGRERGTLDGILIGLALAVIVLIKVTYFVALAPGIVVALALRGAWRTLIVALVTGIVALCAVTLWQGVAFWPAYFDDLLTVATSDGRSNPGRPLNKVLTAPMFLGAHILTLLAVVLLRQGGRGPSGLALLVLFPGLVYVTYQNFGNDPQWLLWVGLFLLAVRPESGAKNTWGWKLRPALTLVAAAMLALISPSFLNMGYSPFRHYSTDVSTFVPVFRDADQHDDFFTFSERAYQVNMLIAGERPGGGLEAYHDLADREKRGGSEAVLNGETFEVCTIQNGLVAWFQTVADNLESAGFANGAQIMTADLLSALPLFKDGIDFVEGGAPWRYVGVPGIENADYVMVPLCAVNGRSRRWILEEIEARGIALTEVYRDPLIILLKTDKPDQTAAASSR